MPEGMPSFESFESFPDPAPEKEAPKVFETLRGRRVELSNEQKRDGYSVDTLLRVRESADSQRLPKEVRGAEELRIVGFEKGTGDVVILVDGVNVFVRDEVETSEYFVRVRKSKTEKALKTPEEKVSPKESPTTFSTADGRLFELTDQKSFGEFRVGNVLRGRLSKDIVTLKGFTKDGAAVLISRGVGIDVLAQEKLASSYVVLAQGSAPDAEKESTPKTFLGISGNKTYEATDQEEYGEYRVKDKLKSRSSPEGIPATLVGFTKDGFAMLEFPGLGGRVTNVRQEDIDSYYEKVEAPKEETFAETFERSLKELKLSPKTFIGVNGRTYEATNQQRLDGYEVGDTVETRAFGRRGLVVGFTEDKSILIEREGDGGEVDVLPVRLTETYYRKVEAKKKEAPTEKSRVFKRADGGEIEADSRKEFAGYIVGEELKPKTALPGTYSFEEKIKQAKRSEVAGFTKFGTVIVQLDGDEVLSFAPDGVAQFYEKIDAPQAENAPKTFLTFGGEKITLTELKEYAGYRVDDLLEVREGGYAYTSAESRDAKEIRVIGFSDYDGGGEPWVVLQIDGGNVILQVSFGVDKGYKKIEQSQAREGSPKTFIGLDGELFEATSEQERGGFRVGQQLKIQKGVDGDEEVLAAQKTKIAGFTPDGRAIIQYDGGRCTRELLENLDELFDRISDGEEAQSEKESTAERLRVFKRVGGGTIEAGLEKKFAGYDVGDILKLKKGAFANERFLGVEKVENAKTSEVVGFRYGLVIIQLDGDEVAAFDPDNVGVYFEKITPSVEQGEKKILTSLDGRVFETTGQEAYEGYRVNDVLRLKNKDTMREVANAKDIRVAGFYRYDDSFTTVAIQIDGGRCIRCPVGQADELFENLGQSKLENEKEAPTEKPRVFTRVNGNKVEADPRKEFAGYTEGEELKPKAVLPGTYSFEEKIKQAKRSEVVGFTKLGTVIVQIDGGEVVNLGPDSVAQFYEKVPVEKTPEQAPRVFTNIYGAKIEVSSIKELRGYKVGEPLRLKKDLPGKYSFESIIKEAKTSEVVGFGEDGRLLIQLDGDKVIDLDLDSSFGADLNLFYEKVESGTANAQSSQDKERVPKVFISINGDRIEATGQRGRDGYRVDDLLEVKAGEKLGREVQDARERKIVGFTAQGDVIIQLDGDKCIAVQTLVVSVYFEKVKGAQKETAPRVFFGFASGQQIEATDEEERGGYRVGEFVKNRVENIPREIVGFTQPGRVLFRIEGNRVSTIAISLLDTEYVRVEAPSAPEETAQILKQKSEEVKVTPEKPRKQFPGLNGKVYEAIDRDYLGTYIVGDELVLKEGKKVGQDIKEAKSLEIVGFTSKDEVIIRLDGGECRKRSLKAVGELFNIIKKPSSRANVQELGAQEAAQASSQEQAPRVFLAIDGRRIRLSEAQELKGYRVGDLLAPNQEILRREGFSAVAGLVTFYQEKTLNRILRAKEVEVLGFEGDAYVVIKLNIDSVGVIAIPISIVDRAFNRISVPERGGAPTEKAPRTFVGLFGGSIESTGVEDQDGYRVGDLVRVREGKTVTGAPVGVQIIRNAKEIRVAGFNDKGNVILQVDGAKAYGVLKSQVDTVYEVIETTRTPQIFRNEFNDEPIQSTGERTRNGYTVGEYIQLSSGKGLSYEVVGFSSAGDTLARLDGNRVFRISLNNLPSYSKVNRREERRSPKKFILAGLLTTIESTGEQELDGYRVGEFLQDRKKQLLPLEIVGFYREGDILLQAPGDQVYRVTLDGRNNYEKVPAPQKESPERKAEARFDFAEILERDGRERGERGGFEEFADELDSAEERAGVGPKRFLTEYGYLEASSLETFAGLTVGDVFAVSGQRTGERKLVGFTDDDGVINAIMEGNGIGADRFYLESINNLSQLYTRTAIQKEEARGARREFESVLGDILETDGRQEFGGYRVDENLRPLPSALKREGFSDQAVNAKEARVIGFQKDTVAGVRDYVVIQLDNDQSIVIAPLLANRCFEKIGQEKVRPSDFDLGLETPSGRALEPEEKSLSPAADAIDALRSRSKINAKNVEFKKDLVDEQRDFLPGGRLSVEDRNPNVSLELAKRLRIQGGMFEIQFRPVRVGNRVEYRNTAPGRKPVVVSDNYVQPEDNEFYRVEVLEDTNPQSVSEGKLVVRITQQLSVEAPVRGQEAQFRRARQMRESVPFQVLARMARRNPEVYAEMQAVLARRQEFIARTAKPGEGHRNFAALFSSLHLNERSAALLDEVIDRTARAQSEWLKERAREKGARAHEIVAGTGTHSAIYRSERVMFIPDDPGLAIEQRAVTGGQFAQPGAATFRLNSRNRPEDIEKPHLPGTEGSLNTMGRHATAHISDSSGESYSNNWQLAQTVRANQFLLGSAITDDRLEQVRRNPDTTSKDVLLVDLRDEQTGEIITIPNERLILSTGLDEETYGLSEENEESNPFIAEQNRLFKNGGDTRLLKFSQFEQTIGDRTNPFPLQGFRNVVTWGGGDSWRVVAEALLGYGMVPGKTVTQLDRVEKVIAIGQKALTKEEYLETTRARYAQLGLEFPRREAEEYYSRIEPYKGRVVDVRESSEGVEVIAEIEDEEGNTTTMTFTGDHGIATAGFRDRTKKVLRSLFDTTPIEVTPDTEISEAKARELAVSEDTVFEFEPGTDRFKVVKIEITEVNTEEQFAQISIMYEGEQGGKTNIGLNRLAECIQSKKFEYSSNPYKRIIPGIPKPIPVYAPGITDPIATQYPDLPIYRIGPASELPLTERERERSPALAKIPQNTAAIFRYAEYTEALARLLAQKDIADGSALRDPGLARLEYGREIVKLPDIQRGRKFAATRFSFVLTPEEAGEKLPQGAVVGDMLNFALGVNAYSFELPNDPKFDEITFHIERSKKGKTVPGEEVGFEVTTTPPLPTSYGALVESLFGDRLVQKIAFLYTERSSASKQKINITLPLEVRGKSKWASVGNASIQVVR